MSDTTVRRKLSGSIATMIVTWINNFNSLLPNLKVLKELANGQIFIELIRIMLANNECSKEFDEMQNGDQIDTNVRFELIKFIFSSQLEIETGINFEAAKNCNDFELAKIALIILIHGSVNEQVEFNAAADKLDGTMYNIVQTFYNLCERDKIKIPPNDIKIYDEFLSSTTNSRRSIKGNSESYHSNVSRNILNGASNAASFLLSPMRRASIKSPREKLNRKSEEDFHNEKKQLEKIIQDKELTIYDQQILIKEKEDEIKQKVHELKECIKKINSLCVSNDKVEECESILERYHKAEKDLAFYQSKCEEYASTQKDLKHLTETNDSQLRIIDTLNTEIEKLKASYNESFLKLKHLGRLEQTKLELENKIAANVEEFQKIVNQKADLSYELASLQKKFKALEIDHEEKIEEYDYKLAVQASDLNTKTAELLKLSDESSAKIADFEAKLHKNEMQLEVLEEQNNELKMKNSEMLKCQQQVSAEVITLKSEIEQLRSHLRNAEESSDADRIEFKKSLKEANLKIEELTKLRDSLTTELSSSSASLQCLKEQHKATSDKLTAENCQLITELANEKSTMTNKLEELRQTLDTKSTEFDKLQKYLKDVVRDGEEDAKKYELTIDSVKNELSTVVKKLETTESSLVSEQSLRGQEKISSDRLIEDLRAEIQGVNKQLEESRGDRINVLERSKKFENECEQLTKRLHELNSQVSELEVQLAEEKKQHGISRDNSNAEIEVKSTQLIEFTKRVEEMQESHASETRSLRARLEEVSRQEEERESEYVNGKVELERKLAHESQSSQEMIKELSSKLETKSKEAKNTQLELDDYKNKLRLATEKTSTSTRELTNKLEEKTEELKRLKQQLEESHSTLITDAEKSRLTIKQITDDLTKTNMAFNEAKKQYTFESGKSRQSLQDLSTDLELKTNEINRLKEEIDELREKSTADVDDYKQRVNELTCSIEEKVKTLNSAECELRELRHNLSDMSGKFAEEQERTASIGEECDRLRSENSDLTSDMEFMGKNHTEAMKEFIDREKTRKNLVEDLTSKCTAKDSELESQRVKYELQVKTFSDRVAELEVQLNEASKVSESDHLKLAEKLTNQEQAVSRTLEQLKQCQCELQAKVNELKDSEIINQKLADEKSQLEINLQKIIADKSQLEANIQKLTDEKFQLEKQIPKIIEENTQIFEEKSQLEGNVQKLSEQKVQLEEYAQKLSGEKSQLEENCQKLQAEKTQMEEHFPAMTEEKTQLEGHVQKLVDEKSQMEEHFQKLIDENKQLDEHFKKMSEEKTQLEEHLQKLQQEYTTGFTSKQREYESILTQRNNEINSLNDNVKTLRNTLEVEFPELKKQYESEIEAINADKFRLRKEVSNKQNDLEALRAKAKLMEEKETMLVDEAQLSTEKLTNLSIAFEKEKKKNDELSRNMLKELTEKSKEIVQLKTKVNESDALTESVREYAKKLEKHYKAKKEEHTDTQNKLSEKISLLAVENRTLREENVFFKEKINTMKFENEQLTIQKDSVQKKLLQDESLAFSYQHVSKNLGSTPRDSILGTPKNKYLDDTEIKYTSPGLTSSQIIHPDDVRRYSIDSFSRGASSCSASIGNQSINQIGSYNNMPALNRFNAISENEYEEPSNNHKSLQISTSHNDSTMALRRLSTLQIRNKQQKPHLQCSYALEDDTMHFANKENTRMSNINPMSFKRPQEDQLNDTSLKIKKSR